MLERMVGLGDGIRDELTRFAHAIASAYYVVPSVEALTAFSAPVED
jgi:putative iron-dependent peroxidase